jgi:ribosome assembly protein RRB1
MSKRSITETATSSGQPRAKAPVGGAKREVPLEEMGEFEDAWEDEIESDEEVVDGGENDTEDGM